MMRRLVYPTRAFWLCLVCAVGFAITNGEGIWPCGLFLCCAAVLLFRPAMGQLARKLAFFRSKRGIEKQVSWSPAFLNYVTEDGTKQSVRWTDISSVIWCEPDWGYGWFGSDPYWLIITSLNTIELPADASVSSILAQGLSGFDPTTVKNARANGYFDGKNQMLECWKSNTELT